MTDTATVMALLRGLHLAAMLSLLGTAGFLAWMLPAVGPIPGSLRRRLIRLWWISGGVALLAGIAWFTLQAADLAGADNAFDLRAALPVVAQHTRYGSTMMARLALLLVATVLGIARRGVYPAILLVAIALGLQGFIGHAGTSGNGLMLSETLHLLAAGLWLGALLPLWISLRALPPPADSMVCQRFSPIGLACVLVIAGSGFVQALQLIGRLPALFGTTYGQIALLKIALFLAALVLATINRLWLTDRLPGSRRHLLMSVSIETALGLAIVVAAGFLASTIPGAHQNPVWPFSWQFSLVTVQEDPDIRQEVLVSLLTIGAASLAMAAALLWRRLRLAALLVLLCMIFWRGPSFSMLTVQAYPTSFQTSPTGFSAAAIAHGQALFTQHCVTCHGPEGEGNGPDAARLRIKPADLTQPHLQEHTDGELFWFLSHGVDDPEGGLAMPGFVATLPTDDRWALIDYVRAHNAGVAIQQDAAFETPVRAPNMPIDCNGAATMADLRGRAVLVTLGEPLKTAVPRGDAVTLVVPPDEAKPAPGSCIAADPAAWNAYAVLADLPADEAAGAAFLIDPNGWMRAVQRPGATDAWHSRDDLLAAIRAVCAHPIDQPSGGSHDHHH
jgi:putative copper export protein/mono/diheme cytochrome c family protein